MPWDDYYRDAEKGTGGSAPYVDPDVYDAMIKDVIEPRMHKNFNGDDEPQFTVHWEITSGNVPEGTVIWQYISLPAKYLSEGILSEKSNLYKTMAALGFDVDGVFAVRPDEWNGMEARIMVEDKETQSGEKASKITKILPKRQRKSAPPQEKREPVAAGTRNTKKDDWDE